MLYKQFFCYRYSLFILTKIIFAVLVGAFFITQPVEASFSPTLISSSQETQTNTDTVTISLEQTAHEGNLLIATFSSIGAVTPNTPDDWNVAVSDISGNSSQSIYYKTSDGTEEAITFTANASADVIHAQFFEYAGAATIDQVNSSSGQGTDLTTGSITLSDDDQLVIALFVIDENESFPNQWNNLFSRQTNMTHLSGSASVADVYVNEAQNMVEASLSMGSEVEWKGQIVSFTKKDPHISLSRYRFYENTDSADVGNVLVDENTSVDLTLSQQVFRLRLGILVENNSIPINGASFLLQYARTTDECDDQFYGERYWDVTQNTPIAFYDNASVTNADTLIQNAHDPAGEDVVYENYVEDTVFSNAESILHHGQEGIWDFALQENDTEGNKTFCLRIVFEDNTNLDSYVVFPFIHTIGVPFGMISRAEQLTDGSGHVELSAEIDHDLEFDSRAKIEYQENSCAGNWLAATLFGTIVADFEDVGGAPDINNANEYQIGSGFGRNIYIPAVNSLYNIFWNSLTDIANIQGMQCLRLTANDGVNDQKTPHVVQVYVDNQAPNISDVEVSPSSGTVGVNDLVLITITSDEMGLSLGEQSCFVNNIDVSESFVDEEDMAYTLSYYPSEADENWDEGQLSISCELKDAYGNLTDIQTLTDSNTLTGDFN